MKQIFADTFYWVALINPQDNWHQRAREVTSSLKNVKLVTTDEVLVELLNFMSVRGANRKRRTVEFIDNLLQNPPDKEYSLTDCISMTVMQRLKISQVLTHDNHFQQEGFIILLESQREN
ncbi:MAG: nucleic acid-binding protein [Microcystis aeruginosa Ma_AC_P_19900807_S299]|nr:MAG: nucleic acid-binding protein [Microcystis aeruginosa Ma_AC_P_19900807_S299]